LLAYLLTEEGYSINLTAKGGFQKPQKPPLYTPLTVVLLAHLQTNKDDVINFTLCSLNNHN